MEDDKHFPPYQGAPLLKREEYPELKGILNKLSGEITDAKMRKMNDEVAVEMKEAGC